MAFVQYKMKVNWDPELIDVGFVDSTSAPAALKGLACSAIKITAGNPAATPGFWMIGAEVQNAVDGSVVRMTGTTASPAWTAM